MFDTAIGNAFDRLFNKTSEHNWIVGTLGKPDGTGGYLYDVPYRKGWKYISMGVDGIDGPALALDRANVAHVENQKIKMRREFGQLVIRDAEYMNGTGSGPGSGVDHFMELLDVQSSGWDNGEIPVWNTSLGKLVPAMPAVGTVYTGGNGISISGTTIAIKPLPTDSALNFNGSGQMYVGHGDGIGVNGNLLVANLDIDGGLGFSGGQIQVKLQPNSGLVTDGNGIALDSAIAGAGLSMSVTRVINVGAADTTITVATDNIRVNQNSPFTWTGQHIFRVGPQIDANLYFIGSAIREIQALNSLAIKPTGDLILDPSGMIAYPSSQESKMNGFIDSVSGIKGFRLWDYSAVGTGNTMMLTITGIKADEIFVRKFTADEARVRRGEWFLAYSYGDVQTDFVMPAINATVDVWFEEAPGLASLRLFEKDDWIKLRTVDMSSVNLATSVWFQAVGVGTTQYITRENADAANNVPSRQKWRLVRRQGGATFQVVKKAETMVDFGHPNSYTPSIPDDGQGMIEMSALAESGGPFIRTMTMEDTPSNVPEFKNRVQMGRLSGTVDYGTNVYWGFAAGDDLSKIPSLGFSGVTIDHIRGARFFNTNIALYEASIVGTLVSRSYGLAILNDTALFANNLRNIAWYDNLPENGDLSGAYATAKIGTFGGSTNRQLHIRSYGTGMSAVFLTAQGGSGGDDNTANIAIKGGGWEGVGTYIDLGADYLLASGGYDAVGNVRPRFRIGGDVGTKAISALHVWEDSPEYAATVGVTVENVGGGDALIHWKLPSGKEFVAGIDQTNGHWKLRAGNTLRGLLPSIDINPSTGVVTINGLSGSGTGTLTATGGDGIDLDGTEINVDGSVARTTTAVSAGDGLAGGGNLGSSFSLYVNSSVARTTTDIVPEGAIGGGGSLAADIPIRLNLAGFSGLTQVGNVLAIADSLAGPGLLMSPTKQLSVNTGTTGAAIVPGARLIVAGNGLTGGGQLYDNLRFDVVGGFGIIVNDDNIELDPAVLVGLGGGADYAAGLGLLRTGSDPSYTFAVDNGAGITFVGNKVALDSAYVLSTVLGARTIEAGNGLGGGGSLDNAVVTLFINTAAGLYLMDDAVGIDLTANSGLLLTPKLSIDPALAGQGLVYNGTTFAFDINKGSTLEIVGDLLNVNQNHTFNWQGGHTFNQVATNFAVNINFIGAERTITSAANTNLNLAPGGDLVLAPVGGSTTPDPDVLPGGSVVTDLGDYNRKWKSLYAGELVVQNLVAASVMATVGGNVRVGPTTELIADFASGATTVDIKHGTPGFVNGTFLVLETYNNGVAQMEAIRLTSAQTVITGGFRFNVSRNLQGGGAKNWVKGDAAFSLGTLKNEGFIDLASVKTVYGHFGPTVTIYARKENPVVADPTSQTWNNVVPTVAMGQLQSFAGIATSKFGFAAANDLTLGPATGLSGVVITGEDGDPATVDGMKMYNTDIEIWDAGVPVIKITRADGFMVKTGSGGVNTFGFYPDLTGAFPSWVSSFASATLGSAQVFAFNAEQGSVTTGAFAFAAKGATESIRTYLDKDGYSIGTGGATGASNNDLLRLTRGGLLGLGTAPAQKLDVFGTIQIRGNVGTSASVGQLLFYNNPGGPVAAIEVTTQSANYSGNIIFKTTGAGNPVETMRLTWDGRLAIGTTNPGSAWLYVKKDVDAATDVWIGNATSGAAAEAKVVVVGGDSTVMLGKYSQGRTTNGPLVAGDGFVVNQTRGNLVLWNMLASGHILVAAGGSTVYQHAFVNDGHMHIGYPKANHGKVNLTVEDVIEAISIFGFAASIPTIVMKRGRGTRAGTLGIGPNDVIAQYAGTALTSSSTYPGDPDITPGTAGSYPASIAMYAADWWTTTNLGTYIDFRTTQVGTTLPILRMRIHHDGNVGIGNVNPMTRLHVVGSAGSVVGADYSFDDPLVVERAGVSNINMIANPTASSAIVFSDDVRAVAYIQYNHADNGFNFIVNAAQQMKLDANGNLAVGSATPQSQLYVLGPSGAVSGADYSPSTDPLTIESNGNNYINLIGNVGSYCGLLFSDDTRARGQIAYHNTNETMSFITAGVERVTIGSTGSLVVPYIANNIVTGTGVTVSTTGVLGKVSSSRRYKRNIRPLDEGFALGLLSGLRPITYQDRQKLVGYEHVDYADDEESQDYVGLIAEEVFEIGGHPFVMLDNDGRPESLQYDRMVAPLVMGWQSHEARIAELEREIARLRSN